VPSATTDCSSKWRRHQRDASLSIEQVRFATLDVTILAAATFVKNEKTEIDPKRAPRAKVQRARTL
jgi:hypothetical protein